ncbi:hypothetical protein [Kitasatospora paranensis]|uniref:HTH cro/C1-type domain-containing protein n=2 Tax=Kitasatospora paranensis TaxID=258053 RepID=A0ABW2G5X3_9ACTN
MSTESHEPEAALVELRKRLDDGLAGTGLTKTMIARRAELSRATVQAAFRPGGAAPSAATVSALARALGLPDAELLHLRRAAVAHPGGPAPVRGSDPGRPIAAWDPLDLEVHPADTAGTRRVLPGYVSRRHDQVLADAVREAADGRSRMLVLVGSSSTGKTRACWEAVQPLAAGGWLLWHPYDPTRAEAALAGLPCVGPRTVVWLNETQHYLGDPQHGERVAAALHSLLTDSARGPVLVLGTLWPEFADRFADLPGSRRLPAHSRVRELMAGRTLGVPDTFDREALRTAAALAAAGDRALAAALTRSRTDGRVTQDLAGAPELLRRYEHGTPAVRALVAAAMDARRLGVGPLLSPAFLADAASDYLTDHDHGRLDDDWAEAALADLARPVHGRQAPLVSVRPRPSLRPPGVPEPAAMFRPGPEPLLRLADFLEQHGSTTRRRLCPPASFWHSAHTHLVHPYDLAALATAAEDRHRLQWAHHLRLRAADAGHPGALVRLARGREQDGDHDGAEALYLRAADLGDVRALAVLLRRREDAGDRAGVDSLCRQAADTGDAHLLADLAALRQTAGDTQRAEALYRQAAECGADPQILALMAHLHSEDTRRQLEAFDRRLAAYRQPADRRQSASGRLYAQTALTMMREKPGGYETIDDLERLADAGDPHVMAGLAMVRERDGDGAGAEALVRRAADGGYAFALAGLAEMREEAGDVTSAGDLYREAADAGQRSRYLARTLPYGLDPDGSPTPAWS